MLLFLSAVLSAQASERADAPRIEVDVADVELAALRDDNESVIGYVWGPHGDESVGYVWGPHGDEVIGYVWGPHGHGRPLNTRLEADTPTRTVDLDVDETGGVVEVRNGEIGYVWGPHGAAAGFLWQTSDHGAHGFVYDSALPY